jgi:hypothetical protein
MSASDAVLARRDILAASTAAGAVSRMPTLLRAATANEAIRPFRVSMPQDALDDLRLNGHTAGELTRDDVLDDFTLYWLTNTAVSAARFYWESHLNLYNAADVSVPAAVSVFPGENYQAPRSWTERAYHKLIYYNRVDRGGH